ncbi:MAG: hypothetical protein ACFFDY_01320 [Candidatus Thorarchaeota archaeon]
MATAANVVFFSASPFGTGDIKTGSPTLSITSGVATLTVDQTGNIGAGDCIDFGSGPTLVYIAPCRIAFNSGSVEPLINNKLRGVTSGAIGIVRAVELSSGSWAGTDAAGYIYFRKVIGTFQSGENINRVRPTRSANILTTNSTLQGNMVDEFVVKDPDGTDAGNVAGPETVNSIHHEYASLSAAEAGYLDANHINDTNLTAGNADIMAHICLYYDHDDQTADSTNVTIDGATTDVEHTLYVFAPQGNEESVNDQKHSGIWNGNKWFLETGTGDLITVSDGHVKLENLQLYNNSGSGCVGVYGTASYVHIGYSIIKATLTGGDNNAYGINNNNITYAYNCIIYDWENGAKDGNIAISMQGYAYNITIFNCSNGMQGFTSLIVHNCIVNDIYATGYPFYGAINIASSYNIGNSQIAYVASVTSHTTGTADGTEANKLVDSGETFSGIIVGNVVRNTTDTTYTYVTSIAEAGIGKLGLNDDIFISGKNYAVCTNIFGDVTFNNEGGDDFHLGAGDTLAQAHGTNLSSDANLPLWDDIDNDERL